MDAPFPTAADNIGCVLDAFGKLQQRIDDLGAEAETQKLLSIIRDGLGLNNAAYLALQVPDLTRTSPYIEVTYSDDWVSHYIEERYVEHDPVLSAALKTILPTDWRNLDRSNPKARQLFAEATDFRLGRQGLTIPVRGANGDLALFSVTLDSNDDQWTRFKRENLPLIQILAHYYHNRVLQQQKIIFPDIKLTPRQVEVLRWAANGKSVRDTSQIMGLSVHTVDTYLELARTRLQALNTAHAVARALKYNLIPPPD